MADLSTAFNPALPASNSNVASDAQSKIALVSDAASNAQSKISARSAVWDRKTVVLHIYDPSSALEAGEEKIIFPIPATLDGMNLVGLGGHLATAATSGVVAVQVRNITSGVDMLSEARKLEWDATEKNTKDASASSVAVINTANDGVSEGDEVAVDIDAIGSGAKGLWVWLAFEKP